MNQKKQKVQLISALYSALLAILLIFIFLIIGFAIGIFNTKNFTRILHKNHYYNGVHREILETIDEYMEESSLDGEFLHSVISKDRVYISGQNYLNAVLKNEEPTWNSVPLQGAVRKDIILYLQEESIMIENQEITALVDEILSIYKEKISIPFVENMMAYRNQFLKFSWLGIVLLLGLSGAVSFLLLKVYKHIFQGISYIVYSTIAASIITTLGSAITMLIIKKDSKFVWVSYYDKFINDYWVWNISVYVYIGIIGLIVSAIIISFNNYLKNQYLAAGKYKNDR